MELHDGGPPALSWVGRSRSERESMAQLTVGPTGGDQPNTCSYLSGDRICSLSTTLLVIAFFFLDLIITICPFVFCRIRMSCSSTLNFTAFTLARSSLQLELIYMIPRERLSSTMPFLKRKGSRSTQASNASYRQFSFSSFSTSLMEPATSSSTC